MLSMALTGELYFLEIDCWTPTEARRYNDTMFTVDTVRERYSRTMSD